MDRKNKKGTFSGKFGFVMAAAGSAVGLGNIWRFPYLAAKGHGGVFILCYVILALTVGFALLTTEIAIGRKTGMSPLTAYGALRPRWKGLGVIACLVPVIILPYYGVIGGWVMKYFYVFASGGGRAAAEDGFFTSAITAQWAPIFWMLLFIGVTSFIVYRGVNRGIEKFSRIIMPVLVVFVIGIGIYALTIRYTDGSGVTRTGLQGLAIYLIPNFDGLTVADFFQILMNAMGQLFFSISVAMGIMVTYGSYVEKDVDLMKSINHIEIFDTLVAFLAGLMIIPAVYTFMGMEGMSSGPGLMFVSLPKIFREMHFSGTIVGVLFFLMVVFAAVTSSVSIMEAIVSSMMDARGWSRKKGTVIVTVYAVVGAVVVCLGYNILYFELPLPNGSVAQILDVLDFVSNNCLMPLVALLTCVLIGWIMKPDTVIDEVMIGSAGTFRRKGLYVAVMKVAAPVFLVILLLQSVGALKL